LLHQSNEDVFERTLLGLQVDDGDTRRGKLGKKFRSIAV